MKNASKIDLDTESFLKLLADEQMVRAQKVPGVKTVLVVLSSRGMVFDTESLRQKVLLTYPEAAIFFITTIGKPVGAFSPQQVDLIIDFTGPGQRQGLFFAKKLRRMARMIVGRNSGFFRSRVYDRVFDEKSAGDKIPSELLPRERIVQRAVLALAGIPVAQSGDSTPDLSHTIALNLPLLSKM